MTNRADYFLPKIQTIAPAITATATAAAMMATTEKLMAECMVDAG